MQDLIDILPIICFLAGRRSPGWAFHRFSRQNSLARGRLRLTALKLERSGIDWTGGRSARLISNLPVLGRTPSPGGLDDDGRRPEVPEHHGVR